MTHGYDRKADGFLMAPTEPTRVGRTSSGSGSRSEARKRKHPGMQWHRGCLDAERACVLAFLMPWRIKFCDKRCYCIEGPY